jgi:hypothetical protein
MLQEEAMMTIDSVVQILRNSGIRNAGIKEASLVLAACRKLPGCSIPVSHGNMRVVEDIMRCSPIAGTVFIPMSFLRLSQSLHANELYSSHPMAGCSLDAARNCVDAPLLVGIMDPHHSFVKVGSVGLFRGCIPRFRDCMSSIIVADATSAEAVSGLMQSRGCAASISMEDRMRRSKFSSSRQYRVRIPRFGIDDTYTGSDPTAAVQHALDEAFEKQESNAYYRRRPKEFTAQFYLMDPVIASEIVQDVTSVKQASIMKFQVGDTVETMSTNGFLGGRRGLVNSVHGDLVTVQFRDGKVVNYDMSVPGAAAALRPVRRL